MRARNILRAHHGPNFAGTLDLLTESLGARRPTASSNRHPNLFKPEMSFSVL
jgi:hypothetical protein